MPHPIDRRPADRKAIADLARANKWHNELNDRLKDKHHKKESMFNRAINEAERLHVIGHKTAKLAHKIRHHANDARHDF